MKQTPYIRVGTSYYKEVKAPTIAGHFNEILVHWNMDTIKFPEERLGEFQRFNLLHRVPCFTFRKGGDEARCSGPPQARLSESR